MRMCETIATSKPLLITYNTCAQQHHNNTTIIISIPIQYTSPLLEEHYSYIHCVPVSVVDDVLSMGGIALITVCSDDGSASEIRSTDVAALHVRNI